MLETLARLHRDDEGQDVIEYGVLAAFISIAAIAVIKLIGPQVTTLFARVKDALPAGHPVAAALK